ncbi:MAG: DDE-type integrase/transposase/recombinase [Candidatus Pacearchaeota archaeon]|nr:DDE-type integrase/transposase/recombinase [Candidatus Pacearchaeota archaeon]
MTREDQFKSKSKNKNKYKNLSCPNCKSEQIIKRGFRLTQNRGRIQRYSCDDCDYRFVKDDGFYRMRNSPQKITLCLDLFFRGISTRKIQEHLQAFYPKNASWVSVYYWVIRYSKIISKFTDNLKLKVGKEVQVDEIEYHRRKHPRKGLGIDKNWFIDSIDTTTRFIVTSGYEKSRERENLKRILKNIKNKTENQVKIITTDGLTAYTNIVKKTFGYNNKERKYTIKHKVVNASQGEGFNHPIERLHNSVRHRTKTFRGFHGSVESAKAIMKGIEIYYNFITKHQAINYCPYELAIPQLKGKLGNNKWLNLIRLAKRILD